MFERARKGAEGRRRDLCPPLRSLFLLVGALALLLALASSGASNWASPSGPVVQPQGTLAARALDPGPEVSVLSVQPDNCTGNLPVWTNVSVRFSSPMDPGPTEGALEVAPSVANAEVAVSHNYVNWTLTQPLGYGTTYTVTVTTQAQSSSGGALATPWVSYFSTQLASVGPAPQVSGTCPAPGASDVPLNASVMITFDQTMEAATLPSSFSISPPVLGGSTSAGGFGLGWFHTHLLLPNTTYTVEVAATAESVAGVHLVHAFFLNFTTGPSRGPATGSTNGTSSTSTFRPTLLEESEAVAAGVAIVAASSLGTYLWIRRSRARETGAEGPDAGESTAPSPDAAREGADEGDPEGASGRPPTPADGPPKQHDA